MKVKRKTPLEEQPLSSSFFPVIFDNMRSGWDYWCKDLFCRKNFGLNRQLEFSLNTYIRILFDCWRQWFGAVSIHYTDIIKWKYFGKRAFVNPFFTVVGFLCFLVISFVHGWHLLNFLLRNVKCHNAEQARVLILAYAFQNTILAGLGNYPWLLTAFLIRTTHRCVRLSRSFEHHRKKRNLAQSQQDPLLFPI